MLFKRTWRETQLRLWLAMAGMVFLTALTVFMYRHSGSVDYPRFIWQRLYAGALVSAWPMISLVLGTVGLVCRSCSRMGKPGKIAGSLHYLLTLPVSRWQILVPRLQIIALQVLAVSVVQVLSLLLLSPLAGQTYSFHDTLEALPLVVSVGAVCAALGLLLSLLIESEGVALGVGYCIVLPLSVCASYMKLGLRRPEFHWTALVLLICFFLCSVQIMAAKRILERKEY